MRLSLCLLVLPAPDVWVLVPCSYTAGVVRALSKSMPWDPSVLRGCEEQVWLTKRSSHTAGRTVIANLLLLFTVGSCWWSVSWYRMACTFVDLEQTGVVTVGGRGSAMS